MDTLGLRLRGGRQAGTPADVIMFRAAGAEPSLSIYDVAATIEARPA